MHAEVIGVHVLQHDTKQCVRPKCARHQQIGGLRSSLRSPFGPPVPFSDLYTEPPGRGRGTGGKDKEKEKVA